MNLSKISIATLAVCGLSPGASEAGGSYTRAHITAPIATVALGPYSTAKVAVANADQQNQNHAAVVTAPLVALSIGPGRTALVQIASSSQRYSTVLVTKPAIAVAVWRNSKIKLN